MDCRYSDDYHHSRTHDLHTSRHHYYTGGDDLDYDTSGDHHNATCHHHLDPRSVLLHNT
jgi:hypothetical protein